MTSTLELGGLIIVTAMAIGSIIFWRLHHNHHLALDKEVRERSHEVANTITVVRSGLKYIARSPDPIKALLEAMKK